MKWVCFPKFYGPLAIWPWLRISPQSSLNVIYCLIITAWQQWMRTFLDVMLPESNKSPSRQGLGCSLTQRVAMPSLFSTGLLQSLWICSSHPQHRKHCWSESASFASVLYWPSVSMEFTSVVQLTTDGKYSWKKCYIFANMYYVVRPTMVAFVRNMYRIFLLSLSLNNTV